MRPAARLSKRLCIQLFFSCHFHRAPTYPLNCPPDAAMSAPHLRDDEEFIDGLSSGVLKEFRNYYLWQQGLDSFVFPRRNFGRRDWRSEMAH
jgi:hypothetical protein